MQFFTALIEGYGGLALTVLAALAIVKAGLAISKDGFRKALSRGIAFIVVVAALSYLANPFLNWLFVRTQANVGQNLFAQSALQLTKDAADILENASVSGEPMHLDTSGITALQNTAAGATSNSESAAGHGEPLVSHTEPQSNVAAPQNSVESSVRRPLVLAPEYLTATPVPLVLRSAANNATPYVVPDVPLMLQSAADGGGGPQTYTVGAGDSLSKIASRFGVSVNALCTANGLRDCNVIARGKKLVIP
jgi:LysM repeat protein